MRQKIYDFHSRTYAEQKKATYEEIKAYVLENTGLKVSNLYIAQVKQKYGIIERENYNIRKATRRMDCLQANSLDVRISV